MDKEKEITELKNQGMLPIEVIKKGYKKATVYKVFKGKLDNFVVVNYQVTGLKQVYNMVEMSLQPYHPPPPPEEIERAKAEAELEQTESTLGEAEQAEKLIGPASTTDIEKLAEQTVMAYKKYMPGLTEVFKMTNPKHSTTGIAVGPISQIEMINQQFYLTIDQYIALGSPSLLSLITLRVDRVKNN
jgi:hypothetical protein